MARSGISFQKYQGTGNDFVIFDGRDGFLGERGGVERRELAQRVCDRHFGIGSDGMIILEQDQDVDFYMDFYNPDGSQSFCGNGSRCAVAYYNSLRPGLPQLRFRAIDGIHSAESTGDGVIIHMRNVAGREQHGEDSLLHTGSPHYLIGLSADPGVDMIHRAREVRFGETFAREGVNVNFIWPDGDKLCMRTYERGVEDETLSCGTGVTAAALESNLRFGYTSPVTVITKGGALKVHFEPTSETSWENIKLEGPAHFVFTGEWPHL